VDNLGQSYWHEKHGSESPAATVVPLPTGFSKPFVQFAGKK
jgi:hypothetical protein